MTGSGNFIARWSRLKRENDPHREAGHDGEATTVRPSTNTDLEEAFDPASLPSIDAITAATDVRGFLQSRVPLELTRAALRRAWASDPSIRDFIGIAENQWDFNDPNAIPGFGPLEAAHDTPGSLARVIGGFDRLPQTLPPSSISDAPAPTRETLLPAMQASERQQVVVSAAADSDTGRSPDQPRENDAAPAPSVEDHDRIRNQRRHGGAVPQ